MRDFSRQAKDILSVYLARGEAALAKLREGRIDEASEILKKRNAAFHNFKAQDALAQAEGQDLSLDVEGQEIWQKLRTLEPLLAQELKTAHDKTGRLYQRIREARQKISRYHSGNPGNSRFEKTA